MSGAFWSGFWSVFRHPFVIYMLGIANGFCIGMIVALYLTIPR